MLIIPAIDIRAGKVVRLRQGNFRKEIIYSDEPTAIAKRWACLGAPLLHLVDLDGALYGEPKNLNVVEEIAKAVNIPIEFGGGIRRRKDIEQVLNRGIDRIILGTKACEDESFLKDMIKDFGQRIVVSIDSKGRRVLSKGWKFTVKLRAQELAKRMEALGVKALIYTNTLRDGTLKGPDLAEINNFLEAVNIPVIVSGGLSSLEHLKELKRFVTSGLSGVIIGRALYEKRIKLDEAIRVARE